MKINEKSHKNEKKKTINLGRIKCLKLLKAVAAVLAQYL